MSGHWAYQSHTHSALRAATALRAVVIASGAGKASEADTRRGKPNKPRPGEKADPRNDEPRQRTVTNYDESVGFWASG